MSKTKPSRRLAPIRSNDGLADLSTRAQNLINAQSAALGITIEGMKRRIAAREVIPFKWRECGPKTAREIDKWAGARSFAWAYPAWQAERDARSANTEVSSRRETP